MTALMVVVPLLVPELVTVPVLFSDTVETVKPPVLLALKTKLKAPVIPPDKVNNPDPVEVKLFRLAVRVMAVLMVRGDTPASEIAVIFAPTVVLIVVSPEPLPLLVIVPTLLTPVVEIVVVAVEALVIVRLPVPVMPPCMAVDPEPVDEIVRLLPLRAMAPVKTAFVTPALLPIFKVPAADVPRLTAFETVNDCANKLAEAPKEEPKVIADVDGPKAPLVVLTLLTPAMAVPLSIRVPPVKVLAPDKVNEELALSSITPVTLVPMTELMVVLPGLKLLLMMVPMLLILVVESVAVPV